MCCALCLSAQVTRCSQLLHFCLHGIDRGSYGALNKAVPDSSQAHDVYAQMSPWGMGRRISRHRACCLPAHHVATMMTAARIPSWADRQSGVGASVEDSSDFPKIVVDGAARPRGKRKRPAADLLSIGMRLYELTDVEVFWDPELDT